MKILFYQDAAKGKYGGIQEHIDRVADCIKRYCEGGNVEIVRGSELAAIRVRKKPILSSYAVSRIIEESEADIVHLHGFSSIAVPIFIQQCWLHSTPVCWTPHFHPFHAHSAPLLAKASFYAFLRPKINKVSRVFYFTEEERSFLSPWLKCPTRKIFNGFLAAISSPTALLPRRPYMLYFGGPFRRKGYDIVRMIAPHLASRGIRLIIISGQQIADCPPSCCRIGPCSREELAALYTGALGVLVPSRYEAFGLVALEALAYGTPVIASDMVQGKAHFEKLDLYQEYGKPEDIGSLLDTIDFIRNLDSADLESFRADAQTVTAEFSWDVLAKIYMESYSKLVNKM